MRTRTQPAPSSLLDYGVVGDLHTAALVSRQGSIDWLCWPRLDSPSLFAALLDGERGGHFSLHPATPFDASQSYVEGTNVLQNEFRTSSGRARLTTFMPMEEIDREEYASQELHGVLEVLEGSIRFALDFRPRFDYARAATRVKGHRHGVMASGAGHRVVLSSDFATHVDESGAVGHWEGNAGEQAGLVLRYDTSMVRPVHEYGTGRKLRETTEYWHRWLARGRFDGAYAAAQRRSALVLKLLTYAPTGALAAAATTSLPEAPGGARNWDYRLSWVRDSAFAMRAFHALGYTREAHRYLRWLRRLLRGLTESVGQLKVCYGLEGETTLEEVELPHLRGYLNSRPVRVGNAAVDQFQLDIFGSISDALYEAYDRPEGFPDEAWRTMRALADHVTQHWKEPDQGIWEIRGPRQRYTHSALMSWVALDRAIRVAVGRGHPEYGHEWASARDEIRNAIETQGWDPDRGAFVQSFGSKALDASLLLIPIVGFLPARDARVASTIRAIQEDLGDDSFVYRYRSPDGLQGGEGAFLLCSLWMVHALVLAGEVPDAQRRFERLSRLAGPLGLLSEEVDCATGTSLGNFPQALTHLAQIHAALALSKAASGAVF